MIYEKGVIPVVHCAARKFRFLHANSALCLPLNIPFAHLHSVALQTIISTAYGVVF